jgi:hypothetical protein
MGCSFSGLNALYDTVGGGGGGDVWVSDYRFRVLRRLGDTGPAGSSVFLVKEVIVAAASSEGTAGAGPGTSRIARKKGVDASHISGLSLPVRLRENELGSGILGPSAVLRCVLDVCIWGSEMTFFHGW